MHMYLEILTLNHCSSLCICKDGPWIRLNLESGDRFPAKCSMFSGNVVTRSPKNLWSSLSSPCIRLYILFWRHSTANWNIFLLFLSSNFKNRGCASHIWVTNSTCPCSTALKIDIFTMSSCVDVSCSFFNISLMQRKTSMLRVWIHFILRTRLTPRLRLQKILAV